MTTIRPRSPGRPLKGELRRQLVPFMVDAYTLGRLEALAPGKSRGDILVHLINLGERYGIPGGAPPKRPSPFG